MRFELLENRSMLAISIGDAMATEAGDVVFEVSRDSAASPVVVTYSTQDGTATDPADYTGASPGTLTLMAGETQALITVSTAGDSLDEDDETFFVNLINADTDTITDGQGQGTIVDDDPLPVLSIGDASLLEGNSGTIAAVFEVMLSPASSRRVTVVFTAADGSAMAADGDYQATTNTLTFSAGATVQPITVLVNGDTKFEPDETFLSTCPRPSMP